VETERKEGRSQGNQLAETIFGRLKSKREIANTREGLTIYTIHTSALSQSFFLSTKRLCSRYISLTSLSAIYEAILLCKTGLLHMLVNRR
jgi:hypothetical protein